MSDILALYASVINDLLSLRIPGVGITWGSMCFGIIAALIGSRMVSMIFGVLGGSLKRELSSLSAERTSNSKPKAKTNSKPKTKSSRK